MAAYVFDNDPDAFVAALTSQMGNWAKAKAAGRASEVQHLALAVITLTSHKPTAGAGATLSARVAL